MEEIAMNDEMQQNSYIPEIHGKDENNNNNTESESKKRKEFIKYTLKSVVFSEQHNDEKTLNLLTCSICLHVMEAPVSIVKCQHTFCRYCLNKLFTPKLLPNGIRTEVTVAHCPQCRDVFTKLEIVSSRMIHEFIETLKVPCIHRSCDWVKSYSELESHVNNDCKFLKQCECNYIFDSSDLEEHQQQCQAFKLQCECGKLIQRSAIEYHLKNECQECQVNCLYSNYGCTWVGKRSLYATHTKECKPLPLAKENLKLKEKLKKYQMYEEFRASDCFVISGISDEDTERASLVQKFYHSYFDLGFNIRFGDTNTNKIVIGGITNDSIFTVNFSGKLDNYVQLDIDHAQGVLAITLNGKHNRFFIFRHKTIKPTIKKEFGRIYVTIPHDIQKLTSSVMVFAHRKYSLWNGGSEYPFEIEFATRYFTNFFLRCGDITDQVVESLKKFFNT